MRPPHRSGPAGSGLRPQYGTTLTIVLVLIVMLQVLALTQADIGWVALREASARRDRLLADAAAEAALVLCARLLVQRALPVHAWPGDGEPAGWRAAQAFSGLSPTAYSLGAIWPAQAQIPLAPPAPQCLAESRVVQGSTARVSTAQGHTLQRDPAVIVLLTARGVGLDGSTQSYRQRIWRSGEGPSDGTSAARVQGWRSVAAVPN